MLILLGKTASGKSSIVDKLVNEYGYEKIITYTTRPMREGEVNGKDYNFITKEAFLDKIDKEEFMEYKVYHTINGDWYYGCDKKDFLNNQKRTVIILTLEGYKDFINTSYIPHTSILIKTNRFITKLRLFNRGDNKKEIKRRIKHDNIDFKDCDKIVDYSVNNNGLSESSLNTIVQKIFKLHMKGNYKNENLS